jgi:hypothetical protein
MKLRKGWEITDSSGFPLVLTNEAKYEKTLLLSRKHGFKIKRIFILA